MTDTDKRDAAVARLRAKREFSTHLIAFLVVNAFLVFIWWITTDGNGYFWPAWVLAGWGIGLAMHAWETWRPPISETAIQRQMEKM